MKILIKYGLLTLAIITIIGFALKGNIIHEQFDSEKWKNWTESETELSLRWDMMNSLRKNHELKGKTKSEIIELLGNPENQSNESFRYYLGMAKHGIDTGSLIIQFNKNNTVLNYYVWHG
ncbi:hypothetical protein [Yeosuana marina]|uniref:hypothetical protein n=1 Tax=Yeosuana marina TaxID=1565536 RepID=UPI00141F7555|nr:hypothetical protein [Yeosuana marina]